MIHMIHMIPMIHTIAATLVSLSIAFVAPTQAPAVGNAAPPAGNPAPAAGTSAAPAQNPAMPAHPNLWPQDITSNGKTYRVFQPRVTGIDGARAYLVTQVSMDGADGKTVTGNAQLQAEMMAADVPGEIEINQFAVRALTIDGKPASDADVKALSQALYVVAMTTTRPILLQNMRLVNARGSSTPGVVSEVPAITLTQQPTVLIAVDGAPRMAPLGATGWTMVTNTASVLLKSKDGSWWTRVAGAWVSSAVMETGYVAASAPPAAEVVAALGTTPALPKAVSAMPPLVKAPALKPATVMVATKPTVLVSIDGPPVLGNAGPGVQCVKNTNSILLTMDGNSFYVLAAGRWFMTASLGTGAWSAVAPGAVPVQFAGLPHTKRYDGARAAVPGTDEANEATLAAREIRTVTLNRAGAQPKFSVAGGMPDGNTAWASIPGSPVKWLPGASQPVLLFEGKTYCCDSGAWFTAPSVTGPWTLAETVPGAIYALPTSCPAYACTYVWVFGATPDTVTFGFSPGYLGTYLMDGTPVYGTGRVYSAPAGSAYRAYPTTYGSDATYDAQTGTFSPPDDPNDDYAFYGSADVNPMYLTGDGWGGWGWCSGWNVGWGYGMNNWWGWNHWGWWMNQWHPYYNRWADNHSDWQKQGLADAAKRNAERTKPIDKRSWPAARGSMANAGQTGIRSAANQGSRRDASPEAATENQQAINQQFQGAAGDAPAAFRGPGNEYGYPAAAYRSWTGMGSNLGGNWGYSPLARPNGFHPTQQFANPGAYWGSGTQIGNNLGPNAGPYSSPTGHGGWGTYDRWAGEGIRGTEYSDSGDHVATPR